MYDNYLIYSVGIYLRLSKEDEFNGQSESIGNQKDFIMAYVLDKGWNIYNIYIDDGYSGLNYDRPAFQQMIKDIEAKQINLVITKDLSRLGRDYIDTGYYLERYFPQANVRYIALNDGIDTGQNTANNDMSPFKAVINDMYAKDISKKIKAVFNTKRANGQFIGAFAPYGYKKDPNNINKFIIDEDVAHIVRRIFNTYLQGESMCGIVKKLNAEKVPCPAKYKGENCTYKNINIKRYIWGQETVKRILTNPSYMGNMAQRRQEKINYKVNKFKKIAPKNWIVKENTHEPIISKEDFYTVQELIQKRIIHYAQPDKAEHLLNGLLFCKDCGAKMTYRRNKTKKMNILCMSYTKYGLAVCTNHLLNEELVNQYVISELRKIAKYVLKPKNHKQFENISLNTPDDYAEQERELIIHKLDEVKEIIKTLYTDKIRGIIDEEMFLQVSKEYNEEKEKLSKRYIELSEEKNKPETEVDYLKIIQQIANFEIIDKIVLAKLIKRIEISDDKNIYIMYNFKNPFC